MKLEPKNLDVLFNIAYTYVEMKEYDKGIMFYEQFLEIEPNDEVVLNNIGWAYQCKGEKDKAIDWYHKSLEVDPGYEKPLLSLWDIYIANEQYDETIAIFKKALEKEPFKDAYWIDLGRVYRRKEEYEKAIEAYERAIELNPRNKFAWNNIGWVYHCKKEYKKAVECYTRSLEIDPFLNMPISNLYNTYNKIKKSRDKDIDLWKKVANAFFISNQFNSALEVCNRVIEIKADDKEIKKLINDIMISKRKYDMLPVLREKINETLVMFSSISYSVLLRDVVNYITYKVPNLEFNNREIKFEILEYIKKQGLSVKLDENKLVFLMPDEIERKKKYII